VQSALLRSHVVRLSVRPSVCNVNNNNNTLIYIAPACRMTSEALVDCDHTGWKSWKLIAQAISTTHSLVVAKGDPPTARGTRGNYRDSRCRIGKNGMLENKSGNISETRKDREKVTMGGL